MCVFVYLSTSSGTVSFLEVFLYKHCSVKCATAGKITELLIKYLFVSSKKCNVIYYIYTKYMYMYTK